MAAAYHAPPCLSCAHAAARDLLAISALPHRDPVPFAFVSSSRGLEGCGVRSAPPTRSSHLTAKRKGMQSPRASSNSPEAITASSWNDSVLQSDIPVLVEFWASWCGPCRMVHRVLEEIAREYAGRIRCFKLDTDEYPQVPTFYSIERIPTILVFKNGEKLDSFTGTLPKYVYVAAIERSLSH